MHQIWSAKAKEDMSLEIVKFACKYVKNGCQTGELRVVFSL